MTNYKDFVGLVVLTTFVFFCFVLMKVTTAKGDVEYCYIRSNNITGTVYLFGSIDWRDDIQFGSFDKMEDLRQRAASINCEIRP